MVPTINLHINGMYISQLIRISQICDKFASFGRHRLLSQNKLLTATDRLIRQGFWYSKLFGLQIITVNTVINYSHYNDKI